MLNTYQPKRGAQTQSFSIRNGSYRVWRWESRQPVTAEQPLLVMLHGWMDVGASFQFVVDAMNDNRTVVAADWRGFGHSVMPPTDSYWFADYLGDLDALLDTLAPQAQVDLLGHSMGGNVVMSYAGVRPERVRKLINLEGFGLPATRPQDAPKRLRTWLDELKTKVSLRDYDNQDAVATRLKQNNPRLTPDRAAWLAAHWAEVRADGRWHILGDPAHKRVNPVLYQREEIIETWRHIAAPLLWVDGQQTDVAKWWGNRYPRSDFDERLSAVKTVEKHTLADCGHMLHLDQPEQLAQLIDAFLSRPV